MKLYVFMCPFKVFICIAVNETKKNKPMFYKMILSVETHTNITCAFNKSSTNEIKKTKNREKKIKI